MSVEVALDTPLAAALNAAIQPKLAEVGWSTGDDASALSEYIILMLVNGKTQEQIAAELSGDLLNLGENDPGAKEFSQWLFQQIEVINTQQSGGVQEGSSVPDAAAENMQDEDMGDAVDTNIPTGPKSMRNGPINIRGRDKRMLGQLSKAMDRTHDSVLHRVRPQNGNERINTHSRGLPTGPRQQGMPGRGGPRMPNNRMNNNMGGMPMMQGNAAANIMNMNPQQQMDLFSMLEQQSRLMAQVLGTQAPPMGRGGPMPMNNRFPQQPGRSLFERAQPNPRGGGAQRGRRGGKFGDHHDHQNHTAPTDGPSSSMDVEMSQEKEVDYENTRCRFDLTCTNKDCKFVHQSPAAPAGTAMDMKDTCSFGAACKNRKCVGKHPSPAQRAGHQAEQQDCKFFPNCTNNHCPFKHPTMPLCRNGADCTTPDCKFTHSKVMCRFNPCLNPACTFKHIEGQKRGKFEDRVWTADGAKEHVSERKFVDENAPEELIVPGTSEGGLSQASAASELIT